jgi:hypothetical protein
MKQTALQSFWDKIALKLSVEQVNEFLPEFEQAKRMDKEQIIDAHIDGQSLVSCKDEYAEQYYNETFKQDK